MRRWVGAVVLATTAAAGCGGRVQPEPEPEATAFRWTTEVVQGGSGYELVVEGTVGDGHAAYTMEAEAVPGGGDDVLATLATAAVGGPDGGATEVRVLGGFRWYRNPWLLDEASAAMGDDEWVVVASEQSVVADVATAVLNERYDDALRRLLDAVDAGRALEAPTPAEEASELDEILTPWTGLVGPANPRGSEATVTGDAEEGEATWRQVLTRQDDGVDGVLRGHVAWSPTRPDPPAAPVEVVDVDEVTAALGR